jgi:hypothetical protein
MVGGGCSRPGKDEALGGVRDGRLRTPQEDTCAWHSPSQRPVIPADRTGEEIGQVQTAVVERARFEARRRPTQAGPNARMATASASAISFTIEDVWPRLRHDLTVTAKEGYIRCPIWPCTRTG